MKCGGVKSNSHQVPENAKGQELKGMLPGVDPGFWCGGGSRPGPGLGILNLRLVTRRGSRILVRGV